MLARLFCSGGKTTWLKKMKEIQQNAGNGGARGDLNVNIGR